MTEPRIGYCPGESPWNNVISFLEAHARDFPDRPALRWVDPADIQRFDGKVSTSLPHRQVAFRQLVAGINAVAGGLNRLGIKKGQRVIIFLPMGVAMYTAMFAVQRIGAIAVFLDSWARRNQLGASAACARPAGMISHHAAFQLVKSLDEFAAMKIRIIAGSGDDPQYTARLENLFEPSAEAPLEPVTSESTALITFTTGSSGTPKGANRTHRFLAAQHEALSQVIPYESDDSDLPAFPIFSLNNLASGVTSIMPALDLAAPSDRDSAALTAQIQREKVTCATLSPSMLNGVGRFCRENGIRLATLRRIVTGGAPISKDNVRDFLAIAPRRRCGSSMAPPKSSRWRTSRRARCWHCPRRPTARSSKTA